MLDLTHMFFGTPAPLPTNARRIVEGKEAQPPKPIKRKDVRVCITCTDEKPIAEFTKYGEQCFSCKPKAGKSGASEKTIRVVLEAVTYAEYEKPTEIAARVIYTPQTVRIALDILRKRGEVHRKVLKRGTFKFIRVAK